MSFHQLPGAQREILPVLSPSIITDGLHTCILLCLFLPVLSALCLCADTVLTKSHRSAQTFFQRLEIFVFLGGYFSSSSQINPGIKLLPGTVMLRNQLPLPIYSNSFLSCLSPWSTILEMNPSSGIYSRK